MEDVTSWGSLALQIVISIVGIILVTLRHGVNVALSAWAANQAEQKTSTRILKLKEIVDSGLATVQTNIVAEMEKDVRAAMADGKLDETERKLLREKIADYARTTLSTEGVLAAQEVYSIADDKLNDWLANRIEGRVITDVSRPR